MPFLIMNLLLLVGVTLSASLAFVPWPRLRTTSVLRLFVSSLILGVVGTIVLFICHLIFNAPYFMAFGYGMLLRDAANMASVTLPAFSLFALASLSFGVTVRTVRRQAAANLKDGKGFFDNNGLTRRDMILETTALTFAVLFVALAAGYGFLMWSVFTGRID